MTASLDNHTNILRASILRLIGYNLDVPRFYKKISVEFESETQKKKFIELVGEDTLTLRDKWILKDLGKKKLLVKGFTLEPAELKNVNIHLPVMIRARQIGRRSFRSLIAIYAITDFTQKVNSIPWKIGNLFNNNLSLNHPYASEFKNTTYDDFKWILKRINSLSRKQLNKALKLAHYPIDIHELLLEKTLSRINGLSRYFDLPINFKPNKHITYKNIVSGKLVADNYSDYVVEFFEKDPENPYRFSEIFRLFKTQTLYASLSNLLNGAIEKFVPGLSTTDAADDIQSQISDFRTNNPGNQTLPIKAFVSPLASGRVFANRNIVFGQYLGSTAPIQLVDSVGAEANLGVFTSLSGFADNIIPNMAASVIYGRSFVHVRAMPDLTTASSQKIKKLFVPGLMKKLGRVIKDEYECSISQEPYYEESELNGSNIYYVKYDKNEKGAKKKALDLRQSLITSGISEKKIILLIIDRSVLCKDEIAQTRTNNITEFIKEFALNETFIISDTLRLSGNINIPIPISPIPNATVTIGSEHSSAKLKSVILKKTEYGMEITISNQKDFRNGIKEGLNYFIEILSNSNSLTKGNLISKIYRLNLEDIDSKEQIIALRALREIFVSNSHDQIQKSYKPTKLDHDIWSKLRSFRLLWFKSDKMKMNHTVEILVPNKEDQSFSQEERTRKLFSTFSIRRKGNDFQTFLDRSITSFVDFLSIGSNNGDPGQTFMGNGSKVSIVTESELTTSYPLAPITRVEFNWTGWQRKTSRLESIFKKIERNYRSFTNKNLIDRSIFNSSPRLRSYNIKNTLIIYPSAFQKIQNKLFVKEEREVVRILKKLYGIKRFKNYCNSQNDSSESSASSYNSQEYFGENYYLCLPPSMKRILNIRKLIAKNKSIKKVKRTKMINKLYINIVNHFSLGETLNWLGEENFFSSIRITGFRENNHQGFLDYISDTVGTYNTVQGTGVFDRLGSFLGISPYELRAMSYTPGL